jgi:hypothetical protein
MLYINPFILHFKNLRSIGIILIYSFHFYYFYVSVAYFVQLPQLLLTARKIIIASEGIFSYTLKRHRACSFIFPISALPDDPSCSS